jgi:uncharacterized protein
VVETPKIWQGQAMIAGYRRLSARRALSAFLIALATMLASSCTKNEEERSIKDEYQALYDIQAISTPGFDGTPLSGFVIKKTGLTGKLPAILVRTPYEIWEDEIGESKPYIDGLLGAGYAVVIQNERGRYGSGGLYTKTIPFARQDGVATLDWIVRQPWSTGRVGTFGCSSSAENQMALAQANHPAHVAMVPRSAAVAMTEAKATNVREPGQSRRGGVFWLGGWASWFYDYGKVDREGGVPLKVPTPENELSDDWPDKSRGFPEIDTMKRLGVYPTEFENYINRPVLDPKWSDERVSDQTDIRIPTLWMTSWFDYAPQLEIGVFEGNRQRAEARATNDHKLIIASGMHCQQAREEENYTIGDRTVGDARLDYVQRTVDWFDAYVKQSPAAQSKVNAYPSITSYNNGLKKWQTAASWPISGETRQYCLDGGAKATLVAGGCSGTNASLSYIHDPFKPVPTTGGGGYPDELGVNYPLAAIKQARLKGRPDVKTFLLPAFTEDTEIFGNIETIIWMSADVADVDVFAKLVEVLPNGESYNIADTAMRARYRGGYENELFLTPGKPVQLKLPNMVSRHTFRKGSRLGLQISSSNWPQFSINGGTKSLPELERQPLKANIEIWMGKDYPSRVIVPVFSN